VSPGTLSQVSAQVAQPAPTITPSPQAEPTALPTSLPTPLPTPTPAPRKGRHRSASPSASATPSPEPTATPTSPAFSTLDGVWEVQVQSIGGTAYSHFALHQDGSTVSGTWQNSGKTWPITGTYDGRLFRFVIATAPNESVNLTGYIENSTDMVGIVDNGKGEIPYRNPLAFTAEHRAPYKPSLSNRHDRTSRQQPQPTPAAT
jgi:hypothetical protein